MSSIFSKESPLDTATTLLTPVYLSIMNDTGLSLFAKAFDNDWIVDEQLFAGFINAFKVFSEEIFLESFEMAKCGKYSIILLTSKPLIIGFVFQGPCKTAYSQLNKFVKQLSHTKYLWKALTHAIMCKKRYLIDNKAISKLILKNFR